MTPPTGSEGSSSGGPRWRRALTRGITRNVVALGFVSLFTDISSEMLVYVIPLFLANVLLAPTAVIGLIEGVAESTASILKLISGALSDRLSRRRLLVGIGYTTSVASKGLYLLATVWPVVLLGRVGDRFGKGIRTSPRDALIADSTAPEHRGVAYGFHRAMDTTGAFGGVLVAAVVIWAVEGNATRLTADAFRILVLLALIPGILAVATIVVGVRDVQGTPAAGKKTAAGGEKTAAAKADAPAAAEPAPISARELVQRIVGSVSEWRRFPRPFWFFIAANTLFTLGNSSDAFLALRSQNLGLSLLALLLAIVAFNATNAIVAWPAGALSDRVGRRGLIALAWIIYAACYAGFALATSAIWVAPLWIAYGTYYALSEGVGKAVVADLAPGELRATAFGILNAVQGTMILPASVIAGVLWSAVAPPAPFWFGAACAAAATALLLATVRLPARVK
ncbi:MAG TPA: MFS transporter [Candidatus Limnocylindrales bacterium]|jgi:Permeases of the major facilitator superfamily|nr:MFS transporter [Candidatus Limnocylindrales bacterium]